MPYLRPIALWIRRFVYGTLGCIDIVLRRAPHTVVIFCFHSIAKDEWRFSIDRAVFIREIESLLETRKPVTLEEVHEHILGKKKIEEPSFVVCFDDGYQDILSVAGYLKERNIQPALFVLSHPAEANTQELGTNRPLLTTADILHLRKEGWIIGSHGATHSDLFALGSTELSIEIGDSKKYLEQVLGVPVDYFAYPRGRYTKEVLRLVEKAGYVMALSMDDGRIDSSTSLLVVPRVGVDRTHALSEFRVLASPLVISFRQVVKSIIHSVMLVNMRKAVGLHFETIQSRIVRFVEPRLHNHFFYTRAEKSVSLDRNLVTLPFDIPIDWYYKGKFFSQEILHFNKETIEIVMKDGNAPSVATLTEKFLSHTGGEASLHTKQMTFDETQRLTEKSVSVVVVSHSLNETVDPIGFLQEVKRIVKDDGYIFLTVNAIAPPAGDEKSYLGISPAAITYLVGKVFPDRLVSVVGWGNVLAGRVLLMNSGTKQLSQEILDFVDPYFPLVTCVKISPKI